MQANQPYSPVSPNGSSSGPPSFNSKPQPKKNIAKKSGKEIGSSPPNIQQFMKEYNQTIFRNAETDWLNSEQKDFKEPNLDKQQIKESTNKGPVVIPSFWQNNQQSPNNQPLSRPLGTTVKGQQQTNSSGSTVQLEPPKSNPNPVQTDSTQNPNFLPNLNKAKTRFNAIMASKNESSSNTTITKQNNGDSLGQDGLLKVVDDLDAAKAKMQSFQQPDPFSKTSPIQSVSNSPPKIPQANQPQKLTTNNQQAPNNFAPIPFNQTNLQNKPNTTTQTLPYQQNPFVSKSGSSNNPINVDGLSTTTTAMFQNKLQQNSQNATNQGPSNQNTTNLSNNNSGGFQNNQLVSNNNNINNLNSGNNTTFRPNSFNNVQATNQANGSNNIFNTQNTFNTSIKNSLQTQPPNLSFPQYQQGLAFNNCLQLQHSAEETWIVQCKRHPDWNQHHIRISEAMKGHKISDERGIDVLAAMTFSTRFQLSPASLQKHCQSILLLGLNFQDSKLNEKQLRSNRRFNIPYEKQELQVTAFTLKNFINGLNELTPKNYSSCSEKEIYQQLIGDDDIMQYYSTIKDKSVAEFVEQYNQFQYQSTNQLEELAQAIFMAFQRKKQVEKLYADYEEEKKKSEHCPDSFVIDKIEAKQQEFNNLLIKVAGRLERKLEELPKTDLNYQLQDLKNLENQEQHLNNQIQAWRSLYQESQKGETYKQIIDVLCKESSALINKVKEIQQKLFPTSEQARYYK